MSVRLQKNRVYDKKYNLALDVYEPEHPNGSGIMVIHGGGWFHGDKSTDEDWAVMFARAGYVVAAPNYRFAPEYPYPAAKNDIFAAYQWFTGKYSLNKAGVAGASSGGNLAIELGMAKSIPIVSLSGIIDLEGWIAEHPGIEPKKDRQQSSQNDQGGPDDSFYKWFVLNYVGGDAALLKDASLLHRVSGSAGPMLLINSMNELSPVHAVLRLQEKLLALGVPVMTKFIPGGKHAKEYLDNARTCMMDFFKEYLLDV